MPETDAPRTDAPQADAPQAETDQDFRDTASAEKFFAQGQKLEEVGDRIGAVEKYEAAYAADPDDTHVCFRLAYNLDLLGEEDEAIHLYEECVRTAKAPLNALLNLAVLYEDRGKLGQAERCVRQVLATEPDHARARLFLKDIVASKEMVVDDDQEKRDDRHVALLSVPVTDFEMDYRTRNSLRKMDIKTLGDLLRVSEAELRSYKNFGEASIDEIKAMLAQKGLKLGQDLERAQEKAREERLGEVEAASGEANLQERSVGELDLSVRARKALSLLSVETLGDLVMMTEPELMGVKNFGATTLDEIKEKLEGAGLSLRSVEEG